MNVWLLPSAFHPHKGGVEELTLQLGRHLREAGHEVLVVTNRHPPDLPANELVEGIPTLRLPLRAPRVALGAALSFPFSYLYALSKLMRVRPRPDIVHIQCASTQLAVAIGVCAIQRTPLVVTTQGEVEMDANGLFEASAYMRASLAVASRRAARLTACSRWAASSAARVAPLFAQAAVVPNGIDPQQWRMTRRPGDAIVAAWGRHVRQKGFDLLLDAWPLVREAIPSARLLLGGSGPETETLRRRAPESVELVGNLDRRGVNTLISRSRVVVVPSRIEPFGIVALEAMISGRPVVWSDRGGLVEATGGLGWPVDPADPRALSGSIVEALRSEIDEDELRRQASQLSWAGITQRYVRLYEEALLERASGGRGAGMRRAFRARLRSWPERTGRLFDR